MTKDYPIPILEERINSVNVSIVGVEHTPKFSEEHFKFFEDKIKNSDAVVLEQPLGGDFWESDFFGDLGCIASWYNKKVYQSDPQKVLPTLIDLAQGTAGIYLMIKGALINNYGYQGIIEAMLGSYMFLGSFTGKIMRVNAKQDTGLNYGLDDLLLYGYTDYRDIKIAEGIKKICHKVKGLKKISCFHGQAHSRPVQNYIRHPILRNTKKIAYLPYSLISETKVREYTYVDPMTEWALTREI